jgi:hypothetical protein
MWMAVRNRQLRLQLSAGRSFAVLEALAAFDIGRVVPARQLQCLIAMGKETTARWCIGHIARDATLEMEPSGHSPLLLLRVLQVVRVLWQLLVLVLALLLMLIVMVLWLRVALLLLLPLIVLGVGLE